MWPLEKGKKITKKKKKPLNIYELGNWISKYYILENEDL